MSTDRTKTLVGPYTLELLDSLAASKFKLESRNKDKVNFEIVRDIIEEELDDGSKEYFKAGMHLKIEANFSEVDTDMLNDAGLEDSSIESCVLSFPLKNKKVTVALDVADGGDLVYGEVSGGGGKVTILKSIPLDQHIDDLITIAAIS